MSDEVRIDNLGEFMADLRAVARGLLRQETAAHSVRPTALVLTALRRSKRVNQEWSEVVWADREHFFRSIYGVMRRALTDYGRRRRAEKRPPAGLRVDFTHLDMSDLPAVAEREPEHVIVVEEALEWLAREDDLAAQIVQHHYFAGATIAEIAKLVQHSEKTVKRRLTKARLLLQRKIIELLGRPAALAA